MSTNTTGEEGLDAPTEVLVSNSTFNFLIGSDGGIGGTGDIGEDGGAGGDGGNVNLTITGADLNADVEGNFLPLYAFAMGGNGADGGGGDIGGNGGNGGDVLLTVSGNNLQGNAAADFLYIDLTAIGGNAGYGGIGVMWGNNGIAGDADITFNGNHLNGGEGTDTIMFIATVMSSGPNASVTISNNIFDTGSDSDVLHIQSNIYNYSGTVIYDMHDNQFIGGDGLDDVLDFSGNGVGVNIDLDLGTVLYADNNPNVISYNNIVSGFEHLFGTGYDDVLKGDSSNNILLGDYGNDSLTGGEGVDTYYFGLYSGQDTITDFQTGTDKIDLSSLYTNATDLAANITEDTSGNAVIHLSAMDTVTFQNVTSQALLDNLQNQGGSDFLF